MPLANRSLVFIACLFLLPVWVRADDAELLARRVMELSREEVERKLATFDEGLLDYRMDDAVYRRVVNYIENWPISSGRMLARSARFYPIFEEQLRAAGLPDELKHLSLVESALRSWATSPVGAGGLWQLMPGTARELGLIVNDELDERLDPTLGCAAGLEYLKRQYARYGDWALALAAYNGGPGRVNRAIRRSGSRDFWRLRRFLPRETRNYVPNFIAAIFLAHYHHHYGLPATKIALDDQLTERIPVYRRLSLYRVAQVTGLRPEVVIEHNPQYLRGYLPGLPGGHLLQLPARVVPAMQVYLNKHPYGTAETDIYLPWAHRLLVRGEVATDHYYETRDYPVLPGDSLTRQVATHYELEHSRLLVWSERGALDTLQEGETLQYYHVRGYRPYDPRYRNPPPPAPTVRAVVLPAAVRSATPPSTAPPMLRPTTATERLHWWREVKSFIQTTVSGGASRM